MKFSKLKLWIYSACFFTVLVFCSFKLPTKQNENELLYTKNVTTEYEEVMKELLEVEETIASTMTEEEKHAFTPLLALAARTAAAAELTVAAVRVTAAMTRTAAHLAQALGVAAQTAGGVVQLLRTALGGVQINEIPTEKMLQELNTYNMYKLK